MPISCTEAIVLSDPRTRGRLKPSTLRAYRKDLAAVATALPELLEVVQRVLGHRDPRSTQGYAELAEVQVRAALEAPS